LLKSNKLFIEKVLILLLPYFLLRHWQITTADSLYNLGHYKQALRDGSYRTSVNHADTTDEQVLYHTARACVKLVRNDSAYPAILWLVKECPYFF